MDKYIGTLLFQNTFVNYISQQHERSETKQKL